MNTESQPIMIMELIQKYICTPGISNDLPELSFVWALAKTVKEKGCYCGVSQQIMNLTPKFNEVVENLSTEQVNKISKILEKKKLCFGILKDNQFKIKCY